MKPKREISIYQKLKFYFKTTPFLLGEVMILLGILGLFKAFQSRDFRFSLLFVFSILGFFFVREKYKNFKNGSIAVQYGSIAKAVVIDIRDMPIRQNKRSVKEYIFEFSVENQLYGYRFDSAYHRHIEIGTELEIYYLAEDPNISVVPSLFGIKISNS